MNKFNDKTNASLNRMKSLMTYGMQNESKASYNAVENSKIGLDGKMYGIIREGSKYYIKECASYKEGKKLVSEDFNYIGGFGNRKNNQYESFADAQKNFDLKLRSIREAYDKNSGIVIESWNPDAQEKLTVESTQKMRKEIMRERQIMANAAMISEGKSCSDKRVCGAEGATQKPNIKQEKHSTGDAKKVGGNPFTEKPVDSFKADNGVCPSCGNKPCTCTKTKKKKGIKESEDVLAWNDNEDYLDTSSDTSIGDTAPFDVTPNKKEDNDKVVEEGTVMHLAQNQNTPVPGVGEIGDDAPFNEDVDIEGGDNAAPITEDDDTDYEDDDELPVSDEEDGMEEPIDGEPEFELETDDDDDIEDNPAEDDIAMSLDNIQNLLGQILSTLGGEDNVNTDVYDDEPLYDEDDEDTIEDDVDLEMGMNENTVYETRAYRRLMREEENRLDTFGKHPAYQKRVMTHPSAQHQEVDGYYDMNDDSVKNESPYGEQIGDTAPFDVDPEAIANSIAESIKRVLKKKSN